MQLAQQARAEGAAEGAWAPAPLPHDAQSALLSRQFFFYTLLWRSAQCNREKNKTKKKELLEAGANKIFFYF